MYNFINMVNYVEPKSFLMENAPTLISRGKVILDYLVSTLGSEYYIIILRDYAGNHEVPMKRQRTMILGFKKEICLGIPELNYESHRVTVGDIFAKFDDKISVSEDELVPERTCKDLEQFYGQVSPGESIMTALAKYSKESLQLMGVPEDKVKTIIKLKEKLEAGKGAFEKSPSRLKLDSVAPSLASVIEFIHPAYNRPLTVREYARLMGYPEEFEFVNDSKAPYIQCIAQGVPVNFVKWAATNIKEILEGKHEFNFEIKDLEQQTIEFINACNPEKIIRRTFSKDSFNQSDNICK
ncbi:MAG: DNA cytosine methyltransferase [Bacilli bacterium]|nr:DNA cytosine methyltransferase [Bacilli bacterium]